MWSMPLLIILGHTVHVPPACIDGKFGLDCFVGNLHGYTYIPIKMRYVAAKGVLFKKNYFTVHVY